jgi:hypothetical protein
VLMIVEIEVKEYRKKIRGVEVIYEMRWEKI